MTWFRATTASLITAATTTALTAAPAFAYANDAGDEPGAGMSVLETVGIFVVLPLAIIAGLWLVWQIPAWRAANRPTTGEAWNPAPQPTTDN